MDLLAPLKAFDRFQRRVRPLAIAVAVLRNFSDQEAGPAAALIAYWGFFSLFPLLLVFVTVLGFILKGDPSLQHSIVHSAVAQFPIIGSNPAALSGSALALAAGLGVAVFSGLGVTVAVEKALSRVYAVPRRHRPDFLTSRWWGLKLLVAAGLLQLLSTAVSGVVSAGLGGTLLTVAGIVVSLLLNLCLFYVSFRFLIPNEVSTRELLPGILIATGGWEVLQAVGGLYVRHVIRGADQTYGTFATVIGLLAWLYLGARIVVYAAEINVVLTRRLWPRSIMDPPEPADRRARAALAKAEERDDKQTVEVSFHPPSGHQEVLGHPPYAVAPAPDQGERASSAAPEIAAPDLHVVTARELLEAICRSLDQVDAPRLAIEEAQQWVLMARDALSTSAAEHSPHHADAIRALADATTRTLGLAPSVAEA